MVEVKLEGDESAGAEREFAKIQREYFEEAEVDHFEWTTAGPGFAETEDELLARAGIQPAAILTRIDEGAKPDPGQQPAAASCDLPEQL